MERRKLSSGEIEEKLKNLDGWTVADEHLKKRYTFPNFAASLAFVNKVGAAAEALDHHPDITFGWGFAEFSVTTHDRGGLTEFDFALANEIETLTENGK